MNLLQGLNSHVWSSTLVFPLQGGAVACKWIHSDPAITVLPAPSSHLETLNDPWHGLVFQPGILALGVLPDQDDIDVLVSRRDRRHGRAMQDVRVEIQTTTQFQVPGFELRVVEFRLDVALEWKRSRDEARCEEEPSRRRRYGRSP